MLESALASFVTLFVVIDPIGTLPLFASLTAAFPASERARTAKRGVAIATIVLVLFALGGAWILDALGIGLPAFRIAGGVLLLLLSIDMVMVRHTGLRATTPKEEEESAQKSDVSVFPLAIPLVAGPGAMTSIVLLMGEHRGDRALQGGVLAMLGLVLLLTLACFLAAGSIMDRLGITGVNVVTRVFGILTAALAVQFILDGATAAFSAL